MKLHRILPILLIGCLLHSCTVADFSFCNTNRAVFRLGQNKIVINNIQDGYNKRLNTNIETTQPLKQSCQSRKTTCISGIVIDSLTLKPLQYASVYFPEYDYSCHSDNNGYFHYCMDTSITNYLIVIKYIGYNSINIMQQVDMDNPIIYKLNPITINIDTTQHPIIMHRNN